MRRLLLLAAAGLAGCGGDTGPSNPGIVSTLTPLTQIPVPPQYGVHDTFVRDGIAFVCAWNTGLIILDVGNGIRGGTPAVPVEISRVIPDPSGLDGGPAVHNAWWFHNPVTGERRYVFTGQEGPAFIPVSSTGDIHVIDVSDLGQPHEVAFYHLNETPPAGSHNFWMDEPAQILYAAFYNGGVVALDVSGVLAGNLASREIARIKPPSTPYMWGVQLSGGFLYATDMINGLVQLRFGGGAFTAPAGGAGIVAERYTSDLWVNAGYAYTGTWGGVARNGVFGNVVKIWRLGPGGTPALADSLVLADVVTVGDVKGSADGKLLVVAADKGPRAGLYLYRLNDPARPVLVGLALLEAGVHTARLADIGGRRYVFATRNPGSARTPALLIYDVTALAP